MMEKNSGISPVDNLNADGYREVLKYFSIEELDILSSVDKTTCSFVNAEKASRPVETVSYDYLLALLLGEPME